MHTMRILVIYDDTQETLKFLERFTPDFDLELLECTFATTEKSALEQIESKTFEQIIIAGQSIDKRNVNEEHFIPYNFLKSLSRYSLSNTRILLVSVDHDFLNKAMYVADGVKIDIERYKVE